MVGTCFSCHNGDLGKDPNHIGDNCDCHWIPANFDVNITGSCVSCHNGVDAAGKGPTHILTTDVCEDCHNNVVWEPADMVDHLQVVGTCSSCHNGTIADRQGSEPHHQWRQLRRLSYDRGLDPGELRSRDDHQQLHQLSQRHGRDRQGADTSADDRCV